MLIVSHTDLKAQLLGSFLKFTRFFFKIRTGREFKLSVPEGMNESHFITMAREFTSVFRGETLRLLLNCPPGWSKSEMCKHFIAWTLAHYPDSQYMYISYSAELAAKHTYGIKQIIELPHYRKLFDIEINRDSRAKDNFAVTAGGAVKAFGSDGSITGQDMGLVGLDRWSGCGVMDDMHKPKGIHSDTLREAVCTNYIETIAQRPRNPRVPIMFVGQCLHEDGLDQRLAQGFDASEWRVVKIAALDKDDNAIHPEVSPREKMLTLRDTQPYVFASQFMQNPIPAGGGLFKADRFVLLPHEPNILFTFLTVDTAETEKTYNDATVFSFWGLYKIEEFGMQTNLYGLHWIDCREIWIEPDQLEAEFIDFYRICMMHSVQPKYIGIEKKSTGVTLSAVLKKARGLIIMDLKRTVAEGSKTDRFLDIQSYVNSRLISLPQYGSHTPLCVQHCSKITANNTHARDDIADTLADAVKLALIDKIFMTEISTDNTMAQKAAKLMRSSPLLFSR